MTAQQAYAASVRNCPKYHDGSTRKTWDQLGKIEQDSWRRNPTPRNWKKPEATS